MHLNGERQCESLASVQDCFHYTTKSICTKNRTGRERGWGVKMKHWIMGALNLYLHWSKTLQPHRWSGETRSVQFVIFYRQKVKTALRVWSPDSLVCIAYKQVSFICSIMLNWKSFKLIKNWRVLACNYVVIALNKHDCLLSFVFLFKIFISSVFCMSYAVFQKLTESLSWIFIPVPFQSKTLQSSALLKPAVIGFITD